MMYFSAAFSLAAGNTRPASSVRCPAWWWLLLVLGGATGAGAAPPLADPVPEAALPVFVSVPPLRFLARRVGGGRVRAHSLVCSGHLPEHYEPAPARMVELGGARIFFRLGFAFEQRLLQQVTASAPALRVVDLRPGSPGSPGAEPGPGAQEHDTGGHRHGPDPHSWNSPRQAIALARRMAAEFIRADPPGEDAYLRSLRALEDELEQVDRELRALLEPFRGRSFYVLHPAWGHFAAEYGLVQFALEEEGVEPQPRRVALLLEQARGEGVRVVFVQPWHRHGVARIFAAELGVRLVELDPLAPDLPRSWHRLVAALLDSWNGHD